MPQNDKDGINGIMKQKAKKTTKEKKLKKLKKTTLVRRKEVGIDFKVKIKKH